ncbi:MAG: DUF3108 domain-containing protein, partial [Acidobacteriota bacterium]|nr:DUF3108 domain-containing protein [Acidobacteriota bacterium]
FAVARELPPNRNAAPTAPRSARAQINVSGARAPAEQQSTPFRVGEQLNYRVEWAVSANAASVEMTIPERRNIHGWKTWHFRAAIHTLGSVRSIFEIDDQFDSYSDAATFETRQFEEYLNELGSRQSQVMHFAASGEEARGPGPTVVVLPGTRDPLDTLYNLRTIDWDRDPEFSATVYDGKNMYQMTAHRERADEPVSVAAGEFSTSRISIDLYQYRRLVSGIHFEIWFANSAGRAPVVMRADLPFGKIRAELISAKY